MPWLHCPVGTAQTLPPNGVTSIRWQYVCPSYFGFIFMRWEEVAKHRPSLSFMLMVFHFHKLRQVINIPFLYKNVSVKTCCL